MYLPRFFLIFIVWAGFSQAVGQTVTIDDESEVFSVDEHSYIFTDESGELTFEEVQNADFKPNPDRIIAFGLSEHTHWVRFRVENETSSKLLLKINNTQINEVELYGITAEGAITKVVSGQDVPMSERELKSNKILFSLDFNGTASGTYYMKVRGNKQLNFPVRIGSETAIADSIAQENLLFGAYFGIMLAMFFYNLFIYLTTRIRSYLYYVLYILCVTLVQSGLQGYNSKFLWPESPGTEDLSLFFLNPATALFSVLFFFRFVEIKKISRFWHYALLGALGLYAVQLILVFAGEKIAAYGMMNLSALVLSIALLWASIHATVSGSRSAIFFLIAWSFFLSSVIVFVFTDVGVLAYNLFTSSVLQTGSGMAVIMLSFGLADQINILRKKNEESQQRALEASRENERLVRNQKTELEKKVQERTEELRIINMELNEAFDELKEAQTQLVDQEKMASLGQLTAGIAHEINNPINFVTSNVNPLKRDVEDVFTVLNHYLSLKNAEDFENEIESIKEEIEDLELDFIREEIFSLLSGIDEGARRTAEIVRGLKVFSRAEEQDIKRVDLIEGLESTITLLNSSLKNTIEVKRDYGDLPRVECYAGKLNQVFMNVLSNAVHVLKEHRSDNTGVITVRAEKIDEDNVEFRIEDNGPGIPEDKINRIFEPFYTTKDVGEGTGLGLSISKSIIAKHNGTITVESEPGKGTAFIIRLPKNQEEEIDD